MNPPSPVYRGRYALLWHEVHDSAVQPPIERSGLEFRNSGRLSPNTSLGGLPSFENPRSHWDLVLELSSGALLCWRIVNIFPYEPPSTGLPLESGVTSPESLPLANLARCGLPLEIQALAVRLFDHRSKYLDYEGPLSGDRGSVKRHKGGHYAAELTDAMPDPSSVSYPDLSQSSSDTTLPLDVNEIETSSRNWIVATLEDRGGLIQIIAQATKLDSSAYLFLKVIPPGY